MPKAMDPEVIGELVGRIKLMSPDDQRDLIAVISAIPDTHGSVLDSIALAIIDILGRRPVQSSSRDRIAIEKWLTFPILDDDNPPGGPPGITDSESTMTDFATCPSPSSATARSVQSPATVEDLFDQLDNFASARETLDSLGLLSPEVATALDTLQAAISTRLADTIKFPPGSKARVVRHGDALYAYDEVDGRPSFEAIEPIDASEVSLTPADPAPAEAPRRPS